MYQFPLSLRVFCGWEIILEFFLGRQVIAIMILINAMYYTVVHSQECPMLCVVHVLSPSVPC